MSQETNDSQIPTQLPPRAPTDREPELSWAMIGVANVAGVFLMWLGGGSGFWANVVFWPGLFLLMGGVGCAHARNQRERDDRVRAGVLRPRSPLASGVALSAVGLTTAVTSFVLVRTYAPSAPDPKAMAEPFVWGLLGGVAVLVVGIWRLLRA